MGFPSEYRHPVSCEKARIVWLPDGEKISKISLFVLTQLTNVTDGQTHRQTHRHRMTAKTALMHSIAVKRREKRKFSITETTEDRHTATMEG